MLNTPRDHQSRRASRREFLQTSAAAVSGAAIASLPLGRSAHAAGSDVLKVGLIGCGGRGSGAALQALNADPNARLVAMADVFADKVQFSRQQLRKLKDQQVAVDDDHCFVGFDAYRQLINSGVDVVLIACASRFHPEYLRAAVDAGKHVFLEKPAAIDPPGIQTVMAACEVARQKGLSVVSGLCWRYSTIVRETMARVLDGAIGDIVSIQETYMRGPYRLVEREESQDEIQYQFRNWYHFRWLSGDDVPQSLLHCLDKSAWALREETPVRAFGLGGRSSSFGTVYGDVFDHQSIVFEYANGVRVYGNCRAQNGCHNEVSDVLLGTKGSCDVLKGRIEGENPWRFEGDKGDMYQAEHNEMFAAIRAGQPLNNGHYMARSSMMAILGQMVVYTGQQMNWDDALKSPWKAGPDECSFAMQPPVMPDAAGIYPVPIPGITRLT